MDFQELIFIGPEGKLARLPAGRAVVMLDANVESKLLSAFKARVPLPRKYVELLDAFRQPHSPYAPYVGAAAFERTKQFGKRDSCRFEADIEDFYRDVLKITCRSSEKDFVKAADLLPEIMKALTGTIRLIHEYWRPHEHYGQETARSSVRVFIQGQLELARTGELPLFLAPLNYLGLCAFYGSTKVRKTLKRAKWESGTEEQRRALLENLAWDMFYITVQGKRLERRGPPCIICTGDRDMANIASSIRWPIWPKHGNPDCSGLLAHMGCKHLRNGTSEDVFVRNEYATWVPKITDEIH